VQHITCSVFSSRELAVILERSSFDRLPECLRQGRDEGAVRVRLVTVFFTQGVDIQQSLANRSGKHKGAMYQIDINRRGFEVCLKEEEKKRKLNDVFRAEN